MKKPRKPYTDSELLPMVHAALAAGLMLLARSTQAIEHIVEHADEADLERQAQEHAKRYFDAGIDMMVACHQAIKTRLPPQLSDSTCEVLTEIEQEAKATLQ